MYVMNGFYYFVFTSGLVCVVKCKENCEHLGTLLYEDIGCSPVFVNDRKCPVKFDCEDFDSSNDTCVFRGRRYNISEEVDDNGSNENCFPICWCQEPASDHKYACIVSDCPEWFGFGDEELEEGCHRKYDVDSCCSTGTICPSREETEVCEFDGKEYLEGERFYPKNTCMKCACKKGFQGQLEEPFCKRNLCSVQISHSHELENNCAPVYFHRDEDGKELCCPNEWVCPSSSEKILKINPHVETNSDLTCKFGTISVKLGEGFDRTLDYYGREKNVTCECILPPLITCKEI